MIAGPLRLYRAQLLRLLLRVDGAERGIDPAGLLPTQNLERAVEQYPHRCATDMRMRQSAFSVCVMRAGFSILPAPCNPWPAARNAAIIADGPMHIAADIRAADIRRVWR